MSLLLFINSPEEYMLPCLSKQFLNLECLGCGLQRSVVYLFQGQFFAAFKMYPAIYPLLMLAVFLGLNFYFNIKNGEKIKITLVVLSITFIVINYVIKLIN